MHHAVGVLCAPSLCGVQTASRLRPSFSLRPAGRFHADGCMAEATAGAMPPLRIRSGGSFLSMLNSLSLFLKSVHSPIGNFHLWAGFRRGVV